MRALATLLPLLAGCGLGWLEEDPGGADNLPTLGAGPYGRLRPDPSTPADEPYLLTDRDASYTDPACLRRADGGLRVWVGWVGDDDPPGSSRIGALELPSITALPDVPLAEALAPSLPWEAGYVGAPTAVALPDRLVLYYQGGGDAPAIGRAESTDDGRTWSRAAAPVLADAAAPSAVVVGDTTYLFVTRPGQPGIWVAEAPGAAGTAFTLRPDPAVSPRPGLAEAFDGASVGAPHVAVEPAGDGRTHWGLWFAGSPLDPEAPDAGPGGAETAIGYAGSFDGVRWERFGGAAPVLDGPAAGPCVLLDGPRGVLLFHEEERLRQALTAAVHP
jgi:hypothetical protein